jgi:5-methylcytosine-specific restriction endonuclease McrA
MDTLDTFTGEVTCPETVEELIANLQELQGKRRARHKAYRAELRYRKVPRGKARKDVLDKIGSRCHICGAKIVEGEGQVDHVLAFSAGGSDEPENYLPAHKLCNVTTIAGTTIRKSSNGFSRWVCGPKR